MTATRTTRLLTLLLLTACGTEEDPVTSSPLDAGVADAATSDGADAANSSTGEGGSGPSDSGVDTSAPKPAPGTLYGACIDGGCNVGMFCVTHGQVTMDGGSVKGCQVQVCTQGCDAGCPAPSPGCGAFNRCTPPSCL